MSIFEIIEHILLILLLISFFRRNSVQSIIQNTVRAATSIGSVQQVLDAQMQKQAQTTVTNLFKGKPQPSYLELPKQGIPHSEVLQIMSQRQSFDVETHKGVTWGYVYDHSKDHRKFQQEAALLYLHTNALNPTKFPSLLVMEVEIVAMTSSMLHGDPKTCAGHMSSGGTESMLLAVYTYREWARQNQPEVTEPEMIMCVTGHPCMDKAAHYFGIKVVKVPYNPVTYQMDIDATAKAVNKNTILILGSAAQFAQGVVDPIEELGVIAQKHQLPLHVDGAIGGFCLPWFEKLGVKIPLWDFRVPGVTSISLDVHKYGFASAQGSSVCVYRSIDLRTFQYFAQTGWPGGIYFSPTMLGTRGGTPFACAWSSLVSLGEQGFLDIFKDVLNTLNYIIEGIKSIQGLYLLVQPHMSIIAFGSQDPQVNIFHVGDAMDEMGWHTEKQMSPDCIHCSVMPQHSQAQEKFVKDLAQAVDIVRKEPTQYAKNGTAATYGLMAQIPDEVIVEDFMKMFMNIMYSPKKEQGTEKVSEGKKNK